MAEKPEKILLEYEARAKVGASTDACIDAHAAVRKLDRAEVIREVLDRWAAEQLSIRKLIDDKLNR